MSIADKEQLKLKYIFLTHAHQDHIAGVNEVIKKYPKAKLCLAREEYDDFTTYSGWKKLFDLKSVAAWQKDSSIVRLMDYNYKKVGKPDIFLSDNQMFMLGTDGLRNVLGKIKWKLERLIETNPRYLVFTLKR
jgi:glyoxylase-like metal-dependent hydrolase (beta-lactamase superfamily II)